MDIRTPDPPSPLISQLVGSYFCPISLPHTVTKSKNQNIYSSVRPLTAREFESANHISHQRLTVDTPKISGKTSEVNSVSVEEEEITAILVFTQNATIRIEQEAIRKSKVKRRKVVFKCKTCSFNINGTIVPHEFDSYNSYQQHLIGQKHEKKLAKN